MKKIRTWQFPNTNDNWIGFEYDGNYYVKDEHAQGMYKISVNGKSAEYLDSFDYS